MAATSTCSTSSAPLIYARYETEGPLFSQSEPLLERIWRQPEVVHLDAPQELRLRAAFLDRFFQVKTRLETCYPFLRAIFQDLSHPLTKGFNEKQMQVAMSPATLFPERGVSPTIARLGTYLSAIEELFNEKLTEKDLESLLIVFNNHYSFRPSQSIVENERAYLELYAETKRAVEERTLSPEMGMVRFKPEDYQAIYLIRKDSEIIGKFKPLQHDGLIKEILGESYNALFGTDFAPAASGVELSRQSHQIGIDGHPKAILLRMRTLLNEGKLEDAMQEFDRLKLGLKYRIYYYLYLFKGEPRGVPFNYGEAGWNGSPKFPISNTDRIGVIDLCLLNENLDQYSISKDPETLHLFGTLQCWEKGCVEAKKLIETDPEAGLKIRNIPVATVHLYNILALIKGACDCHLGNTLFQLGEDGQIDHMVDCDDEFILPGNNSFHHVRIWTLGLPQALEPIPRSLLTVLSSAEFAAKFIDYNKMWKEGALSSSFAALRARLDRLQQICVKELAKPCISLSSQELYFELYGGREKFERMVQEQKEFPPFSIFEYFMSDGLKQYISNVPLSSPIFQKNVKDLYATVGEDSSPSFEQS